MPPYVCFVYHLFAEFTILPCEQPYGCMVETACIVSHYSLGYFVPYLNLISMQGHRSPPFPQTRYNPNVYTHEHQDRRLQ